MSTYAIASAIEKFANDFTKAINEKNKIEKDKLAFEKEKFEFNKQQLDTNKRNGLECNHDWHINGRLFGKNARYTMHTCSICGEEETLKTYLNEDDKWITHSV